jgi:purine nucleosidase
MVAIDPGTFAGNPRSCLWLALIRCGASPRAPRLLTETGQVVPDRSSFTEGSPRARSVLGESGPERFLSWRLPPRSLAKRVRLDASPFFLYEVRYDARMLRRALIAILLIAFTSGVSPAAAQQRMKILLDTDIGTDIDDAWALGLLIASPEVELVGVTITDGDTAARAKVACKLLHVSGRNEVPVAVGRPTPPPDQVDLQFTWAEDFTAKRPVAQSAANFIVEALRKQPGEITLVAVGPLQNVADALRKEPKLGPLAKRVVLMSGSIAANAWSSSAVAEWNVKRAIADAQLVYGTGLPLTTVPLDSTTYVTLKEEERERLMNHPAPLTRALESLYRLWIERPSQRMTLHDQMAVAETLRPGAFFDRCGSMPIRVDDRGYTLVDKTDGKPVSVCLEPKRDEFMKFYLDGLMMAK